MELIIKKADIVLIAILITLAVSFYFAPHKSAKGGYIVRISVGGSVYRELPLFEDGWVEINEGLENNLRYNRISIKNGEAAMVNANCPDGLCLRHKPVKTADETIICLPNRVVIEILGDTLEYDAVAR